MERSINNETRLAKMEQKIDNLIEGVERVNSNVEKVDLKLEKHVQSEAERYDKLDAKYSGKWVEKLTLAIAGGLVIAVLTFLLK